jgi:hypothetical protein
MYNRNMNKNKDKMQRSIDNLTEWQENQYNPGHWIGGITPKNLIKPRNPKILGIFLILVALSCLIPFGFLLYEYLAERIRLLLIEHVWYIAQIVLLGGFALLIFIGGFLKVFKTSEGGKK